MPALLTRPASLPRPSSSPTCAAAFFHGLLVGDVREQGHEVWAELALQTIGIALLPHCPEHAKAFVQKNLCGTPTNAGGHTCNNHALLVDHV